MASLRETADETIGGFLKKVDTVAELEPVSLPRRRRPTARLTGDAAAHHPTSVTEYLRHQFFTMLDRTSAQLDERFGQPGVKEHEKMEGLLHSDFSLASIAGRLSDYPWKGDLSAEDLAAQLSVVFRRRRPSHLLDAVPILRGMGCNARELFPKS